MMKTFNRTLNELKLNNEENLLSESDLKLKAFNLTLIENSKTFFKMLTNKDEENEEKNRFLNENYNNTEEIKQLKELFEKKGLNKNSVYKQFVHQFSNKFDEKVLDVENTIKNTKAYKRLMANVLRFKQRYNLLLF